MGPAPRRQRRSRPARTDRGASPTPPVPGPAPPVSYPAPPEASDRGGPSPCPGPAPPGPSSAPRESDLIRGPPPSPSTAPPPLRGRLSALGNLLEAQRRASPSPAGITHTLSTSRKDMDVIMCGCTRNSSCKTRKCQCKVAKVLCNENCGCQRGSGEKCTNLNMPVAHGPGGKDQKGKGVQCAKLNKPVARGPGEDNVNSSAQQKSKKELIKQCRDDANRLQSYNETLQEYNQVLMNERRQLEEQIELLKIKKEGKLSPAQETRETTALRQEIELLKSALVDKEKCLISSSKELECQKQKLETFQAENTDLKEKVQYLEQARKKLLNEVLDLKGTIRVFCRVRPLLDTEKGKAVKITYPETAELSGRSINFDGKGFSFDKVFDENAGQADIFQEVSELVQSVLDGGRVCVMCYGQTGSGKTHTMLGSSDDKGIIRRTLDMLFSSSHVGWEFSVKLSVLEVYNERLLDLQNNSKELKIRQGSHEEEIIEGLTIVDVSSPEHALSSFEKASRHRSVASTKMNQESSRSHFVCRLNINGSKDGRQVDGILHLVDLAGSEEVGERPDETRKINTSLFNLRGVLEALSKGTAHIPYRNSNLTRLLEGCLKKGSKALIVINISPFELFLKESLSTLKFGLAVNSVTLNMIHAPVAAGETTVRDKQRLQAGERTVHDKGRRPPMTPMTKN